jgi:hypothetical protein
VKQIVVRRSDPRRLSQSCKSYLDLWKRNARFANTSIGIVVKLIEAVDANALVSDLFQVATVVFKGVKVLGDALDKLVKAGVRLWACSATAIKMLS